MEISGIGRRFLQSISRKHTQKRIKSKPFHRIWIKKGMYVMDGDGRCGSREDS